MKTDNADCRQWQMLLSDYIDNALPARQTWEVEKHLASCPDCAHQLRQMQSTVQALRTAPAFVVGDDFMAKLHARLDVLEPKPSFLQSLRARMADLNSSLRIRPLPTLGLSMALALVFGVAWFNTPPPSEPTIALPSHSGEAFRQQLHNNVALIASDPLQDPAAANLEAQTAAQDSAAGAVSE